MKSLAAALLFVATSAFGSSLFDSMLMESSAINPYVIATYGDSRADLFPSPAGPDHYDGTARGIRTSLTNQPWMSSLPVINKKYTLAVNGGLSGDQASIWDTGARTYGRTITAVDALYWDAVIIQYGTNDVQNNVTSTATRDSVAIATITHLQDLITRLLADKPTGKVFFQTIIQRSDTTGAGAYGATNAVNRRDSVDYINYGNGGAITGMVAWVQAHPLYGTRLFVHEIGAITNIGGVLTGAYLDTTDAPDGCHGGYHLARIIAKDFDTTFASQFPDRSYTPMYRAVGANYIPYLTAANLLGENLSHCSVGTKTYGTDANNNKYVDFTLTTDGTAGSYRIQVHADTGTNGGRVPAGPTFVAGDKLAFSALLSVDNGSGGASIVNNIITTLYSFSIGGTPATQTIVNGLASAGTAAAAIPDVEGKYYTVPVTMTGNSGLVAAPATNTGLFGQFVLYFNASATTIHVRIANPQIMKVL